MKRRPIGTPTAGAAVLIVILLIFASVLSMRKHVLEELRAIDPSTYVEFDSFRPSATYGFYVTFKVRGDSEYSYAYWRMFPRPSFSRVEFQK